MDKWIADLGNGNYKNPILYTDYSDPDAIRVGNDYYMIASSFCNSPAIPILHSNDLVNWQIINYALEHIPEERYKDPIHGCGVWAPAIRYHNDMFYIFFPMPDEGIYVTTAKKPIDKWSEPVCLHRVAGWIDPCPFWDDDGRCYMVSAYAKSRIGFKSILRMCELSADGMQIIDMGRDIFDGNLNNQETIEGPKMYKRNGWYYIFAPAGGVKTGWQTVLRSKNIWGPYEYKNVMVQGDTEINGPHQGAWVDTPTGEDWFLHFQDVYAAGRIVHLQPMKWVDDYPIIGQPVEGSDYGVPVSEYRNPNTGEYPITSVYTSDDFKGEKLGLQWQWNANYDKQWYEMTNGNGIKLFAYKKEENRALCNTRNLLLQKWAFPHFVADTKIDVSSLCDGDVTGMVSLGVTYGCIGIRKCKNNFEIFVTEGIQKFVKEVSYPTEETKVIDTVNEISEIYFRNIVEQHSPIEDNIPNEEIILQYSFDGINFKTACSFAAKAGRWVGVKNGVFCYGTNSSNGYATVKYFNIDY